MAVLRDDREVRIAIDELVVGDLFVVRPGEILDKAELMDAVWPGIHVGDAVLKTSVREIRKALADPARSPLFI